MTYIQDGWKNRISWKNKWTVSWEIIGSWFDLLGANYLEFFLLKFIYKKKTVNIKKCQYMYR